MKILITGGAGYIGSISVPYLLDKGHQVSVIDNLIYRQNSLFHICADKNFKFIFGDARNRKLLKETIKDIDIIVPMAGIVGASACDRDPELAKSLNVGAVEMLLEIRSKNQIVILLNTNSGYGIGKNDVFCTEESPLNPLSLYGITKKEAEKAILDAGNSISLRLATAFGMSPRMRLDLLVNNFVYRAKKDRVLVLFEEHFRRNFIHVRDVAHTIVYCVNNFEKLKDNVYNVGLSSANLTKRQLAEKIKEYLPDLTILSAEMGRDPDKRDYIVSNEKLEKTGWQPICSLDDGIQELLKGYEGMVLHNLSNV